MCSIYLPKPHHFLPPSEQINGPSPSQFYSPYSSLSLSLSLKSQKIFNGRRKVIKTRMRPPSSLKEEFLKKWQKGLEICHSSVDSTSVGERRKAIKLTADIAMAALRKGTTCWSRALIAKTANSNDRFSNLLVRRILGSIQAEKKLIPNKDPPKAVCHRKIVKRSKRFLKRSSSLRSAGDDAVSKIARRMVKRKTRGLRGLVPGGELMRDELLLIRETLDYVTLLQMEVDVMRRLAYAAEAETNGK